MKDVKIPKQSLIRFGTPNENGRVYTKESIVKISEPLFCYLGVPTDPATMRSLADAAGTAKVTTEPDGLYVEVTLLDTPRGRETAEILSQMPDFPVKPVSLGYGIVGEDKVVTEFTLAGVGLEPPRHEPA